MLITGQGLAKVLNIMIFVSPFNNSRRWVGTLITILFYRWGN